MRPENMRRQVEVQIMSSYQSLYRLAYTYVKNPDDAMDVVQECVCKALARADDLQEDSAVKSWLFRILVNTALDLLRRQAKERPEDSLPEMGKEDVYRDLDTLRMLDALEERERTVIVLRFFEDLRLQDIAQITGQPLNTVKTILYRSLKKLKVELSEGESAS